MSQISTNLPKKRSQDKISWDDLTDEERDWYTLKPVPEDELTPELLRLAEETRKIPKDQLLNI